MQQYKTALLDFLASSIYLVIYHIIIRQSLGGHMLCISVDLSQILLISSLSMLVENLGMTYMMRQLSFFFLQGDQESHVCLFYRWQNGKLSHSNATSLPSISDYRSWNRTVSRVWPRSSNSFDVSGKLSSIASLPFTSPGSRCASGNLVFSIENI